MTTKDCMTQMDQQKNESSEIVSYDGVSKTYGEGKEATTAINNINFSVFDGEFVTVIGPSGCGKSTLLHATAGILEPTRGQILVDGVDVQTDRYEKHKAGLVFQDPVLLDWRTVLKNVLLPIDILIKNGQLRKDREYFENEARNLLKLAGLQGFEESYPGELSGGMQQRVAICRSLVYDPPIILMDEPFGALDKFTRDELNGELLKIWREKNKTVLFITHSIEEAVYLSDRVVTLSNRPGSIINITEIDLPRPRKQDIQTQEPFRNAVTEITKTFDEERNNDQ